MMVPHAANVVLALLIGSSIAWAGSTHGQHLGSFPLFALGIFLAFAIQWTAFIPAYYYRTERYYDLCGSMTFLVIATSAYLLNQKEDWRSFILFFLVVVWAIRLGSHLFLRICQTGSDSRFDQIKIDFWQFFLVWTLQGLWVCVTLSAALAAITTVKTTALGISALLGMIIWIAGFSIEWVADEQKKRHRQDPRMHGRFIRSGLWAWSRHPKYFGEILVWTGIALISCPALEGVQLLTLLSPVFVYLLITRVSGIPILENKADKKWGGDLDYERYKSQTPLLFMRPPKS